MIASIEHNGETFEVDLLAPIDISIEMQPSPESVSAWYLDALTIEPVKGGGFVGAVNQGGSVNFRNIAFNPHGHGTHTECLGHITPEVYNVNEHLKTFFFKAFNCLEVSSSISPKLNSIPFLSNHLFTSNPSSPFLLLNSNS